MSQINALHDRPLASHLYGVLAGQDLVLLDLKSGTYDLLAGLAEVVTLSADRRSLKTNVAEVAQGLDEMGLFALTPSNIGRPFPGPPTRAALLPAYSGPCPVRDRVWMARGWMAMLRRFYGQSFTQIIAKARTRPAPTGEIDDTYLTRRARTFDRLSVWTPFQGECFFRCQMLLQLLGPQSADVDWVFGVRTWPFYAHCWLQAGDLVLTDRPERLTMFSPILTL